MFLLMRTLVPHLIMVIVLLTVALASNIVVSQEPFFLAKPVLVVKTMRIEDRAYIYGPYVPVMRIGDKILLATVPKSFIFDTHGRIVESGPRWWFINSFRLGSTICRVDVYRYVSDKTYIDFVLRCLNKTGRCIILINETMYLVPIASVLVYETADTYVVWSIFGTENCLVVYRVRFRVNENFTPVLLEWNRYIFKTGLSHLNRFYGWASAIVFWRPTLSYVVLLGARKKGLVHVSTCILILKLTPSKVELTHVIPDDYLRNTTTPAFSFGTRYSGVGIGKHLLLFSPGEPVRVIELPRLPPRYVCHPSPAICPGDRHVVYKYSGRVLAVLDLELGNVTLINNTHLPGLLQCLYDDGRVLLVMSAAGDYTVKFYLVDLVERTSRLLTDVKVYGKLYVDWLGGLWIQLAPGGPWVRAGIMFRRYPTPFAYRPNVGYPSADFAWLELKFIAPPYLRFTGTITERGTAEVGELVLTPMLENVSSVATSSATSRLALTTSIMISAVVPALVLAVVQLGKKFRRASTRTSKLTYKQQCR